MNAELDRRPAHQSGLRIGLLFLAALGGGFWALFLPHAFYEDFPLPGRYWVPTLGPYNEHLARIALVPSTRVRSVGGEF